MRTRRPAVLLLGCLLAAPAAALACELSSDARVEGDAVFAVDPRASQIRFDADAGWHTFTRAAGKFSGKVRVATAFPAAGAEACLEGDAASITTGIEMRDERMRERHLHTDRFPTIRFTLTGLEHLASLGDGRYGGTLRGTLTLHGVTSPLATPAEARLDENQLSIQGQVPLRLSTFGIPAPSFLFVTMKDEVLVRFRLTANRS